MFLLTFIVQDISGEILDKLRKRPRMTLPNVESLKELIDKELTEEIKLPLTQREFDTLLSNDINDICSSSDLRVLFRVSETCISVVASCSDLSLASYLHTMEQKILSLNYGMLTFENL